MSSETVTGWTSLPSELTFKIWTYVFPPRRPPAHEYAQLDPRALPSCDSGDVGRAQMRSLQSVSRGFAAVARPRWLAHICLNDIQQVQALVEHLGEEDRGETALPIAVHVCSLQLAMNASESETDSESDNDLWSKLAVRIGILPQLKVLTLDPSQVPFVRLVRGLSPSMLLDTICLDSHIAARYTTLPPGITRLSLDLRNWSSMLSPEENLLSIDWLIPSLHVTTLRVCTQQVNLALAAVRCALEVPALRSLAVHIDIKIWELPQGSLITSLVPILPSSNLQELSISYDIDCAQVDVAMARAAMMFIFLRLPPHALQVLHLAVPGDHLEAIRHIAFMADFGSVWSSVEELLCEARPGPLPNLTPSRQRSTKGIPELLSGSGLPRLRTLTVLTGADDGCTGPEQYDVDACARRNIRLNWKVASADM